MTDRYAVIGHPVEHSKSPAIHAEFARRTGQDLTYGRLPAPPDGFEATARGFAADGGHGLNVTLPFKEQAHALARHRTARAEAAGAVNTLRFDADGIHGDNTDGAGLVRDIRANLGVAIAGRSLLVLGAGGATRGVLAPLVAEFPRELVVANRTAGRAVELAGRFAPQGRKHGVPVSGCGLAELAGRRFDLVINATSASLSGESLALPGGLFALGSLAYDMMYGRGQTPFLAQAAAAGAARCADGLGMLIEQAAESFLFWRGVRPPTDGLDAMLRA